MYIFNLYHQRAKNKLVNKAEPSHPDTWPIEWKTTLIKTYPRFYVHLLSKPELPAKNIDNLLISRRTGRVFDKKITERQLSGLLFFSIGETDALHSNGRGRRVYSSAGARYPLEFYILIFKKIDDIDTGVYHYNITKHGLTVLKKIEFTDTIMQNIVMYDFARTATMAIIFTATFKRSSIKYKEKSYRFLLLEAGGVMQNFSLCAEAVNISSLSMGGVIDDYIESLIGIDGEEESMVHSMFFG